MRSTRRPLFLLLLTLFVAGCGGDDEVVPDAASAVDAAAAVDGSVADARSYLCTSVIDTAAVDANTPAGNFSFRYLHAGGISFVGPAAPSAGGVPIGLWLYFATSPTVDGQTMEACVADGQPCDYGPIARVEALLMPGMELGTHTATVDLRDGANTWTASGSVTITRLDMFTAGARVEGSVDLGSQGDTISGSFGGEFCEFLMTATI